MKPDEMVEVTQAELDELLRLAKASFPAPQYGRLERVLATFAYVMVSLLQREDFDQTAAAVGVRRAHRAQAPRAGRDRGGE